VTNPTAARADRVTSKERMAGSGEH
jgi:hypothetical protein